MSPLVLSPSLAKRSDCVSKLIFFYIFVIFGVLDVAAVANHLSRHHEDIWLAYVAQRDAKKSAEAAKN